MRTALPLSLLLTFASVLTLAAQEPVLIAGGSMPPMAVMGSLATQPAVQQVVYATPVVYAPVISVVPAPCYPAPNVIYFGGPNSCYRGGDYRPGCSYSPSVIYFGRGEACQRGYSFRYPR